MALSVKHPFQSVKADGVDTTLVQPSNWNASHTITIGTGKLIGRTSSGSGDAEELSVGSALSMASGVLGTVAMTGDVTTTANSFATTIGDGKVTTSKVADAAITQAKLGTDVQLVPTGAMMPFVGIEAVCPTGWIVSTGQTLGDSSSGASKAGAQYEALFTMLWNSFSNTVLPILDSAGATSTRGANAAADFAVHKRLPTPDMRGRTVFGVDNMGGVTANRMAADTSVNAVRHTLGATGGGDTVALTATQTPDHSHGPGNLTATSNGNHTHTVPNGNDTGGTVLKVSGFTETAGATSTSSDGAHTHTLSGITGSPSSGSGDAHNNMPPAILLNWIVKY